MGWIAQAVGSDDNLAQVTSDAGIRSYHDKVILTTLTYSSLFVWYNTESRLHVILLCGSSFK